MDHLFRLACLSVLVGVAREQPPRLPPLQQGDVVLQASPSARSALIRRASASPYSHVGLVEVTREGVFVLEGIEPVSRTPFEVFKSRSQGRVTVVRARGLDAAGRDRVVAEARRFLGRPYDTRYQWGDERIYCSELVAKAFERGAGMRVGRRERIADLHVGPEDLALAAQLGVDPATVVVTPASLAEEPGFQRVFSNVE